MVKKYRKLPIVIEALQWTGENRRDMYDFLVCSQDEYLKSFGKNFEIDHNRVEGGLIIKTLEGVMLTKIGDYIIKGVDGEFYPCKSDIFEKTYELVEE